MFDALTSRVTGETWRKYRFAVEVGVAVVFATIASVVAARAFGTVAALVWVASIITVLHRVRPTAALVGSSLTTVLVLITSAYPLIFVWFPALVGVYGAIVYGGRVQRWVAVAIPPILIVGEISTAMRSYWGNFQGWVTNQTVPTLLFTAAVLAPLAIGVLRAVSSRRWAPSSEPIGAEQRGPRRAAQQILDDMMAGVTWTYWPLVEWTGAIVFVVLCFIDFSGRVGFNAILFVLPGAAVILLYRRHPAIALPLSLLVVLLVLLLGGQTANYAMVIPGVLAMFGSAAYGGRLLQWASLALPVLVAFGAAVLEYLRGGRLLYIVLALQGYGFLYLVYGALLVMAWLIGLVVQSRASRTSAQSSERATAVKLDSALAETMLAEERNRVAREVHDIVAHSLAVVIAQADGAKAVVDKNPDGAKESLGVISATAREALADIRTLLTQLRHSEGLAPQPGFAEIDGLVATLRESGLELTRTDYGEPGEASRAVQATAYRVLQEALTNALRHGAPTPVDLELEWSEEALDLTVTNDLAEGTTPSAGGHGVAGMRERVALVGGGFAVFPGEHGRFRIRVRLPLEVRSARPVAVTREIATTELPA